SLHWQNYKDAPKPADPTVVDVLFPSLEDLTGPAWLCAIVLKSKLTAQLKALEVIDCSDYNLEFLSHSAHPMPNLRKLILGAVCAIKTMVPYRKILSYATKLEKLAFYPPDTELVRCQSPKDMKDMKNKYAPDSEQ
ncbi:hypothetical protein FRC07_009738, partial [Ceratobasidium sp. 392]